MDDLMTFVDAHTMLQNSKRVKRDFNDEKSYSYHHLHV